MSHDEIVWLDAQGVAHPLGDEATRRLQARRQGAFRVMPAPAHVVFMRYVGVDGARDADDGAIVRLAGEVTAPGALCDIIALVAQAGWKGELLVADSETSRSVFFESGNVVGVRTTAVAERIGDIMVRFGVLTSTQRDSVSAAVAPPRRFGETAVELGFVSSEKLFEMMGKQAEEVVFATLTVSDGMYYFLDRYDVARIALRHDVSAARLLMDGIRRLDEAKYFREKIPSGDYVPVRITDKSDPPEGLANVLFECDGRKSVAEIAQFCGLSEGDATKAVFQLLQAGLVFVHPPIPTTPEAMASVFNEAIGTIFDHLEQAEARGLLRAHLAAFATSIGIYEGLFKGAGPDDRGQLDVARIAENVAAGGGDDPTSTVALWLYEYIAFALFDAGSRLAPGTEKDLSAAVRDKLALLAPPAAPSSRRL
jgi:hypothetical protein